MIPTASLHIFISLGCLKIMLTLVHTHTYMHMLLHVHTYTTVLPYRGWQTENQQYCTLKLNSFALNYEAIDGGFCEIL